MGHPNLHIRIGKRKNYVSLIELKATNIEREGFCPWLDKSIECTQKLKEYRSIDGHCNNLKQPLYGLAGTPFQRILEDTDYNEDSGT